MALSTSKLAFTPMCTVNGKEPYFGLSLCCTVYTMQLSSSITKFGQCISNLSLKPRHKRSRLSSIVCLRSGHNLQKVNSNFERNMIKQKNIPQILGVHVFSILFAATPQKAETISVSKPSVKPWGEGHSFSELIRHLPTQPNKSCSQHEDIQNDWNTSEIGEVTLVLNSTS